MRKQQPDKFTAKIRIIGVNPYVPVPVKILKAVFKQAGKDRGKIPVRIKIDGHEFIQTLIKYSGSWRLYLNTPMRKAAGKETGDVADFEIAYDPDKRKTALHPGLRRALKDNKDAKIIFERLRPSIQLEVTRYISNLKTREAVERNVTRAINFLLGKERFIGRDSPGKPDKAIN